MSVEHQVIGTREVWSAGDRPALSPLDLEALRHPSEPSRYALALVFGLIGVGVAVAVAFASVGVGIVVMLSLVGVAWLSHSLLKGYLLANSIKVSAESFPDICALRDEAKRALGYDKRVEVYIVKQGGFSTMVASMFRKRFVMLDYELVEGMRDPAGRAQLLFVLASFVGALKAKHLRLSLLRCLILSVEKVKIFDLFMLPYERAVRYSGDQIGLAVCGDLDAPLAVFHKWLAGNELCREVRVQGLIRQIQQTQNSFFGWASQLTSSHPHVLNRYVNLLAFCRAHEPAMYTAFTRTLAREEVESLEALLPRHHARPRAAPAEQATA